MNRRARMRSRKRRKYRKIEIVDNKVNLVSIKIDKWIKFYDRDLNTIAKFIVIIGLIGLTGLIISIINILRGILWWNYLKIKK